MIPNFTSKYVNEWFSTPVRLQGQLHRTTELQQIKRERQLRFALNRMPASVQEFRGMNAAEKDEAWEWIRKVITPLIPRASSAEFGEFMRAGRPITETFVALAKNLGPSIADADIAQALRNLWVFNSLQLYLGMPVAMTPSAFAYSMLYPCTDNRLDTPGSRRRTVSEFVEWLSLRLLGTGRAPADADEGVVDKLLRMIELEYPRSLFPHVYESLNAIHHAQRKSMRLRGEPDEGDERDLVSITVEKGGASVLADGYLAAGDLTPDAAEIIFAYGVLLQLIDDLQDLEDDLQNGHSSIFTRASRLGPLDGPASRLLNFARSVTLFIQSTRASKTIGAIIGRCSTVLILEAIARTSPYFTRGFLQKVNACAPVRLSFLQTLREHFTPILSPRSSESLTNAA